MRPKFKDYLPESTNYLIVNDMFLENPELYNYIQALDRYIDELEDKILCSEKTESSEVNQC